MDGLSELRTTSWTLTQVGFEGCGTFCTGPRSLLLARYRGPHPPTHEIPRGRDQQSTDWTRRHQRTNRGGGQSRGGTKQGAKPKQPYTPKAKTSKATEEKTTAKTKGQQEPATPQTKNHTESTRTKRHRTERDNQSRPKQTGRTIRAPAHHPEKENRQGRNQENIRPTSQSLRQEARRNTTSKRNELRSTSAPAQSADRHTSTKGIKIYLCGRRTEAKVRMYLSSWRGCTQACTQCKRDQDLSATVAETGKKRGTVHLSSLRTDTRTKIFLHLSETGVKQASGKEHHETELISLNQNKGGEGGVSRSYVV